MWFIIKILHIRLSLSTRTCGAFRVSKLHDKRSVRSLLMCGLFFKFYTFIQELVELVECPNRFSTR